MYNRVVQKTTFSSWNARKCDAMGVQLNVESTTNITFFYILQQNFSSTSNVPRPRGYVREWDSSPGSDCRQPEHRYALICVSPRQRPVLADTVRIKDRGFTTLHCTAHHRNSRKRVSPSQGHDRNSRKRVSPSQSRDQNLRKRVLPSQGRDQNLRKRVSPSHDRDRISRKGVLPSQVQSETATPPTPPRRGWTGFSQKSREYRKTRYPR